MTLWIVVGSIRGSQFEEYSVPSNHMHEREKKPADGRHSPPSARDMVREPVAVSMKRHRIGSAEDTVPVAVSGNASTPDDESLALHESETHIKEEGEADGQGVEWESDSASDDERINEPFDPTKIKITSKQPTVYLILERIKRDEIDLQPDFQRAGNIWPPVTQSRLIESLLLRIPLPVFYMAADEDDKWQVVDGLQRLSALKNFVLDKNLQLRGLEYLSQYEERSYDDLPRPMQRRIDETQLSCHVIEPGTPPEVMFNVFKRINTEGKPLVKQEIRHALNPGPARELLRKLASSDEFLSATDRTVNPKRMADRECVLRFLAFWSMDTGSYGGKLDDFLMSAMRSLNDDPSNHPALSTDFRRAMSLSSHIFGREAFRKPSLPGYPRSPVNKALFESVAVALAAFPEDRTELLRNRREYLVDGLKALMDDVEFYESISVGTQATRKVNLRFGRMRRLVLGVLS